MPSPRGQDASSRFRWSFDTPGDGGGFVDASIRLSVAPTVLTPLTTANPLPNTATSATPPKNSDTVTITLKER